MRFKIGDVITCSDAGGEMALLVLRVSEENHSYLLKDLKTSNTTHLEDAYFCPTCKADPGYINKIKVKEALGV